MGVGGGTPHTQVVIGVEVRRQEEESGKKTRGGYIGLYTRALKDCVRRDQVPEYSKCQNDFPSRTLNSILRIEDFNVNAGRGAERCYQVCIQKG